jgi:hypothetical protein
VNPEVVRIYAKRASQERGRRVTIREAEREMSAIAIRVAATLSRRFVFGYHEREDMEQEGVLIALEVLAEDPPKYDASRPLANFLYVHIHHQLYNLKRKLFMRSEAPCSCCDAFNPPATPCQKWTDWAKRNAAKQNIMKPLDMERISERNGAEPAMSEKSTVEDEIVCQETLDRIDRALPVDLRADYLRMRHNVQVPKSRRQKVRDAVVQILSEGDANANDRETSDAH